MRVGVVQETEQVLVLVLAVREYARRWSREERGSAPQDFSASATCASPPHCVAVRERPRYRMHLAYRSVAVCTAITQRRSLEH